MPPPASPNKHRFLLATYAFVYASPVIKGPSRAMRSFMVAVFDPLGALLQISKAKQLKPKHPGYGSQRSLVM
jgi:hypothetical protein